MTIYQLIFALRQVVAEIATDCDITMAEALHRSRVLFDIDGTVHDDVPYVLVTNDDEHGSVATIRIA